MPVESVIAALAVRPKPRSQDRAHRESYRTEQGKARRGDAEMDNAHPFRNAYGELIGQRIDLTA